MCLLSRIRHQNLVSMEGFCHESKHQILVYEYLPGGSLADHLYGNVNDPLEINYHLPPVLEVFGFLFHSVWFLFCLQVRIAERCRLAGFAD